MKPILIFLALIFCFSCAETTPTIEKVVEKEVVFIKPEIKILDWILGPWMRTNDEEGRKTFEYWEKRSDSEYVGFSYTLENQDTVFKENMRLLPIDDLWHLEVMGVNKTPTYFKFTKQTKRSFVSENPTHDFPKKIAYQLKNDTLYAQVSAKDTDMEVLFSFIR